VGSEKLKDKNGQCKDELGLMAKDLKMRPAFEWVMYTETYTETLKKQKPHIEWGSAVFLGGEGGCHFRNQ
jgi:hypothetical protein